ncbi:MAG: hypothetical protein NTV79_07400 [Candidatus Aureabacteria bacterium]|nr:hypothetical protein [Candidatus Auribacterota bacterium]
MADIVIEVRGGVVVEVYSKKAGLRALIVDWDSFEVGDDGICAGAQACASYETMPEEIRQVIENI